MHVTATVDQLTERAAGLLRAGRPGAAGPLLVMLRRMGADRAGLAELCARAAIQEGRLADAQRELDEAIAIPGGPLATLVSLHRMRADVRIRAGDLAGAAGDAAEAVVLDRRDPTSKALLGVVLIELGQFEDAASCLMEAVTGDPTAAGHWLGLAEAQARLGRTDVAAATLAAGIVAAPGHVPLRVAAVLQAVRKRDFVVAAELAESACRDGVADARVYGLLGHALSNLGRHEDAGAAYAESLKLAPDDPYVRHLVAANGMVPGAERAPADYLRTVFDGYASSFEAHLIRLGYRIPGLLREMLIAAGIGGGPVLDLGCGTGLMGVVLSDLDLAPFVGVDISAGMLAEARAKELYTELHESDLVEFLSFDTRRWRLVLAADVFCYFGSLDATFSAIGRVLAPTGRLALSVEEWVGAPEGGAGWRLGAQGRYAHTEACLRQAATAAGLQVETVRREVLRYEADAAVPGLLAVLSRHDA